MEPRIWLGIAVGALLGSFVPYWYWIGPSGIVLSALLALVAAGTLVANIKGERRLADEADAALERELEERQRRATEGAPSATSGSGTSTEPSSRW